MAKNSQLSVTLDPDLRFRIQSFQKQLSKTRYGEKATEGEAVRVLIKKGLSTIEEIDDKPENGGKGNKIECLICKKKFKKLGMHLSKGHNGMTKKEYIKKFNLPEDHVFLIGFKKPS